MYVGGAIDLPVDCGDNSFTVNDDIVDKKKEKGQLFIFTHYQVQRNT